jgi:glycosyltransferase involved in cell wall biosynthesis
MEAMACGLPCVISRIRGNTDLIIANGGATFDPHSAADCYQVIVQMMNCNRQVMGEINQNRIQDFSLEKVVETIKSIYES